MDRAQWLEERKKGIGGSDSPVVLGVSPFKTPRELALEKLGLLPDQDETPAMRRGRDLEAVAAKMFTDRTGVELVEVGEILTHPEIPWWRANIDRVTTDGQTVVEIKAPGFRQCSKIRREGISEYIQIQGQHYLMLPRFKAAIYVVLDIDRWDIIQIDQKPDTELQNIIFDADNKFWRAIQNGEIPEDDTPPIELPAVGDSRVLKVSSPEWLQAVSDLREAEDILKDAQEVKEAAKAEILRLMGDFEIAESEGFRCYNKSQNGRKTIDSKKLQKMYPEAYEACLKTGAPSKTFRSFFLKERRM